MARSTRDTLIFATILLAPMAAATAYIAFTPTPEPIVIREVVTEQVVVEVAAPVVEVEPIAVPEPVVEPAAPSEPVHQPEIVRPAGAGMLVYEGQVVLTTKPDVAWARGKLRSPDVDDGVVATRAADPARLPNDLRAVADARLVLYRADGGTCTTETGPELLKIYGRQDGEVVYPEAEDGVLTAAELLAARKEVFAEAQLLLGKLRPSTPRCDGLWARRADLPAPAVFAPHDEEDDPVRAQVLAQIASQPAVIALAAEYEADRAVLAGPDNEIPPWSAFMTDTLQVSRWDEVGGARSYVNVIVGDGGEACSSLFAGQAAVLFAIEGGELVAQTDSGFLAPLALMDLERDGHLEAITEGGNRLESNGPAGDVQDFTIPYHGCPC